MEAPMIDNDRPRANCLALAVVPCALGLIACSGIDHATLDGVTTMPDDSTLSNSAGVLHTGIASGFKPRVWTHDLWGTHEQSSGIEVQTSNAAVFHVARVTSDPRVVVWASGPGKATLTVTLNGDLALTVPVTVTDPTE
jgi:hypothetical protein